MTPRTRVPKGIRLESQGTRKMPNRASTIKTEGTKKPHAEIHSERLLCRSTFEFALFKCCPVNLDPNEGSICLASVLAPRLASKIMTMAAENLEHPLLGNWSVNRMLNQRNITAKLNRCVSDESNKLD